MACSRRVGNASKGSFNGQTKPIRYTHELYGHSKDREVDLLSQVAGVQTL